MKFGHRGHLNTRNKFPTEVFFPKPKISLSILDELKNLGFGGRRKNPWNRRGYSHGFTPWLEVDDEARPNTQIHGRNQWKTPQITKSKIGEKYLWKCQKWKTLQLNKGDDSTQKDSYIDANQGFRRCENHSNILPLFGRFGGSLTSLLSSLRYEAHPHLAKWRPKSKGWERGWLPQQP
jgi:hypothetical protein